MASLCLWWYLDSILFGWQCVKMYVQTEWVVYIHVTIWLPGITKVQADFRVRPHILTLTEWLKLLTVNWTNQDLTWQQLDETERKTHTGYTSYTLYSGSLIAHLVECLLPVLVCHYTRACEWSGAERGAERAKYSRSAERVLIQRPERWFRFAPVPLRYRSPRV